MSEKNLRCQVCGCTEANACLTDGKPCFWIAEGVLCSACLSKVSLPQSEEPLFLAFAPLVNDVVNVQLPGLDAFRLYTLIELALLEVDLPHDLELFTLGFLQGLKQRLSITPALAAIFESKWPPNEKGRSLPTGL